MSMNSPHESVKEVVAGVWKNNRPLAVAAIIVVAIIAYAVYRSSQSSLVATAAATTPATGGNTYYNSDTNSYVGPVSTITNPVTGTTTVSTPGKGAPPQPGPIPVIPAAGSLPPYPGGVISQHGSTWYYGNPPNQKLLAQLFAQWPGTTFKGGAQGRAWYTKPGQNQQLLTSGGYGKFSS